MKRKYEKENNKGIATDVWGWVKRIFVSQSDPSNASTRGNPTNHQEETFGKNKKARDDSAKTPQEKAKDELWEKYSIFNVDERDHRGFTALNSAVFKQDIELIKLLLTAQADALIPDINDNTPLHHAVSKGNLEIVKMLLTQPNVIKMLTKKPPLHINLFDKEGNTPLHLAVGHLPILMELLSVKDIQVNVPNFTHHAMPLHIAATKSVEAVKALVNVGADETATDDQGNTPLGYAARCKNTAVIEVLMKEGTERLLDPCDNIVEGPSNVSQTVIMAFTKERNHTLDFATTSTAASSSAVQTRNSPQKVRPH